VQDLETGYAGERFHVRAATPEQAAFWRGLGVGWEDETPAFVRRRARPARPSSTSGPGSARSRASRHAAAPASARWNRTPAARAALEENLARNGLEATILPAALHADGGGPALYGGRLGLGASTISALGVNLGETVHVPTVTAAEVAARAGEGPAAVKVDVEGHEYALGPALAALCDALGGAPMHLSLHPRRLAEAPRRRDPLFARRRATEATARLLAEFGDAEIRLSGEDSLLDPARMPGLAERDFAVEIG